MLGLKDIQGKVYKFVPYTRKKQTKKVVSLTVRLLADELARDPYGFVSRMNRYVGTLGQFENIPPIRKGFHND